MTDTEAPDLDALRHYAYSHNASGVFCSSNTLRWLLEHLDAGTPGDLASLEEELEQEELEVEEEPDVMADLAVLGRTAADITNALEPTPSSPRLGTWEEVFVVLVRWYQRLTAPGTTLRPDYDPAADDDTPF